MKIAVMDFSNMGRWFSSLAYPCLPFCEKLQGATPPKTQFAILTSTTDQVKNTPGDIWGDFLRKGRNKKNDEKSKYYSNKSFDL